MFLFHLCFFVSLIIYIIFVSGRRVQLRHCDLGVRCTRRSLRWHAAVSSRICCRQLWTQARRVVRTRKERIQKTQLTE